MSEGFGSFFSGLFGEPDPEQIERIKQQRAEHFMALEDSRNRLESLFGDLPNDQLKTLRNMLDSISSAGEKAENVADYWCGWAASELHRRGLCSACGVDHSAEALANLAGETGDPPVTPPVTIPGEVIEEQKDVPMDKFRDMTDEEKQLMEQYHLDDARQEGTGELVGFICTGVEGGPRGGCGLIYVSIEDRMRKAPEDCHGCQIRAAQG